MVEVIVLCIIIAGIARIIDAFKNEREYTKLYKETHIQYLVAKRQLDEATHKLDIIENPDKIIAAHEKKIESRKKAIDDELEEKTQELKSLKKQLSSTRSALKTANKRLGDAVQSTYNGLSPRPELVSTTTDELVTDIKLDTVTEYNEQLFVKKQELDELKKELKQVKHELYSDRSTLKTVKNNLNITCSYAKLQEQIAVAEAHFGVLKSRLSSLNKMLAQRSEYTIIAQQPFDFDRMGKALYVPPSYIKDLTVSATIKSDSSFEAYKTTLTSCDCPDFQNRHVVCKHMYALALYMGTVSCKDKTEFTEQLAEMCEKAELITKERKGIDHLIRAKSQEFPMLSAMFAEFYKEYDDVLAYSMATKKPAALKASEAISTISKEKTKFIERAKRSENLLTYLYANVPWLEEYSSLPPFRETLKPDATAETEEDVEYTSVKLWLSRDEYLQLSVSERNQLALDRYISRANKTNWEVGIEYEQYIGYLCETKGGVVQYRGAIDGLDDMGRDLIVEKESVVYIIQCKRWHESKTIHEKHIFQLFGSVIEYKYEHPDAECVGVFVTSSALSQRAKDMADILGIRVYENVLFKNEYPRIKCNISDNGKIYHLPFDQQYNTVKIKPELGEVYVTTVEEAEALGFRRAMRHIVRN